MICLDIDALCRFAAGIECDHDRVKATRYLLKQESRGRFCQPVENTETADVWPGNIRLVGMTFFAIHLKYPKGK